MPIRHLDFWLPTTCLILATITWVITSKAQNEADNAFIYPSPVGVESETASSDGTKNKDRKKFLQPDLTTGLVILGMVVLVGITRYLGPACCLTTTRPPAILQIMTVLVSTVLLALVIYRFSRARTGWLFALGILILGAFIILKSESLARLASIALRSFNSQPAELATALDIRWLGFSYVAFRLLHTLRDRLNGRLPELSLKEFVIYIIFFPAFSAGPIDRVQRFSQDLRNPFRLNQETTLLGGKRILLGMFSKFVVADGLALMALNSANSTQVKSTGWMWLILYAYSLRIFFDFSGYTSIAIGMGQLLGIKLPENFERPYFKQNLTLFWNSWHMTLAQWFRSYFFNPITRALRASPRNIPMPVIIFIGQLTTFILIGLWHGISWNFAIWGAWQGIGLFIHNRWSDWIRPQATWLENKPAIQRFIGLGSTVLTFNYVSLGWVWFALSTPGQSWNALLKLFGGL